MSGGVDSSVTAALLKKEGYDITGVHMVCWEGCQNSQDRRDAMKVAAVLDIPFLTWDFREEYKKAVYEYMIYEYAEGRTPNPDVMCNKQIKFGAFLKKALEEGADFIATGHYVRAKIAYSGRPGFFSAEKILKTPAVAVRTSATTSNFSSLFSAHDINKDQSYFLWTLTQDQLKYCLFPIGDYLKSKVRGLAAKFDLPTSEKKDSQGLCFVGKVDFLDFLSEKLPQKTGAILNSDGIKIGEHRGAHLFTIGQRHGLEVGGQENPVYVASKNVSTNTIVVAEDKNETLYKKEIELYAINWIGQPAQECLARIRYRQPLQKVLICGSKIVFDVPQRAAAQGQSVVFYAERDLPTGRQVLGGGVIK